MSALRFLVAATALVFVATLGCASDDLLTSTVFDPLSQFPDTATYKWDNAANKMPSDDRIQALELDPLIRDAANRGFAERGYTVTTGAADYYLSYEIAVNTWYGPNDSKAVASLSLLLVDAKADRRVWLGYGRAEMHVSITREERQKRLREAAEQILEDFPPR